MLHSRHVHCFAAIDINEPNKMCCTTGNLSKTSTLYILMRPLLTLLQDGTALIFHNWLECSANGPVFTYFGQVEWYLRSRPKKSSEKITEFINWTLEKNKNSFAYKSTLLSCTKCFGSIEGWSSIWKKKFLRKSKKFLKKQKSCRFGGLPISCELPKTKGKNWKSSNE